MDGFVEGFSIGESHAGEVIGLKVGLPRIAIPAFKLEAGVAAPAFGLDGA